MLYDVNNPEQYLNALASDWRKDKLEELRALILKQAKGVEECINYKMLCYKLNGDSLFHLNAQKGYVSLYVGDIKKIDPQNMLLAGLNMGKGCIRFTKSIDIGSTGTGEFIKKSVELVNKGVNLDC